LATLAVFNPKGGVGKTTLAVNLAYEAAASGFRTLLWEVDEQGDSPWLVEDEPIVRRASPHWIPGALDVKTQIRPTRFERLSLIASDAMMRRTDNWFADMARGQRLARLFAELEREFDVILLDCAPGFGDANRTIMQCAHVVIVPSLPAPLALRGVTRLRDFMVKHRGAQAPILPVYSMVDKRRKLHREAIMEHPDWPVIPMRSDIEAMTRDKAPLGASAPNSPSRTLFRSLWTGIHRKLTTMRVIRSLVTGQTAAPAPLPAAPRTTRPKPGSRLWPAYQPDSSGI
jgi:cellulose biosynthesis protein BcsQ